MIAKILKSKILRTALFVVVIVIVAVVLIGNIGEKTTDNQKEMIANATRRSAVQCYVLEGSFPNFEIPQENVDYLEENYGLVTNKNEFVIRYEPMGGNLLPQITVFPKGTM